MALFNTITGFEPRSISIDLTRLNVFEDVLFLTEVSIIF